MQLKALRVLSLSVALLACTPEEQTPARGDVPANTIAGGPAAVSAAPAADWRVRPDGIGPIRVGVPLTVLSRTLGEPLRADYTDFEGCDFIRPAALRPGVSLMVLHDTVVRVDVTAAGVQTVDGIEVGDSEAQVFEVYLGRVAVEPHKYTWPEGQYLVVSAPGDTLHRVIFETDGQHVTLFRAGRRPAVEYVEGCA